MRGVMRPLPNTPSWRGAELKKAQGHLHLHLHLYGVIKNTIKIMKN